MAFPAAIRCLLRMRFRLTGGGLPRPRARLLAEAEILNPAVFYLHTWEVCRYLQKFSNCDWATAPCADAQTQRGSADAKRVRLLVGGER